VALEGLAIDGVEAELRAVAVQPLEVVEERPVKVAGDWNARGLGLGEGREVGLEERGAKRIGAVGEAVLRDEDREAEPARVAEKGREGRGLSVRPRSCRSRYAKPVRTRVAAGKRT
jgi:ribosomal protein L13E